MVCIVGNIFETTDVVSNYDVISVSCVIRNNTVFIQCQRKATAFCRLTRQISPDQGSSKNPDMKIGSSSEATVNVLL